MKQIEKGHDAMKSFADRSYPFVGLMRVRAIHTVLWPVLLLIALVGRANPASGQCGYEWQEGFNLPGADGPVYASVVFDDGSGPALYIGGAFEHVGTVRAHGIARWDGREWQEVGGGMGHEGGVVYVLFADEEAEQPRLIIGGSFAILGQVSARNVALWDGALWSPLGAGTNGPVMAVTKYDDGTGSSYIAGGDFYAADGIAAANIAKWNGTVWSPLGEGIIEESPNYDSQVQALEVFDEDGAGPLPPRLFVGGKFSHAGAAYTINLARWNGTAWSKVTTSSAGWLPGGVGAGWVNALRSFDPDEDGPIPSLLYVGGVFGGPYSDVPSPGIVAWSGSTWAHVGASSNPYEGIAALEIDRTSMGHQLLAAGQFVAIAGTPAGNVAKLTHEGWTAMGDRASPKAPVAKTIVAVNDPVLGDPFYLAAGDFSMTDGISTGSMMKWDGRAWSPFESGLGLGGDWHMAAAWFDDGTGPALWVGTQQLGSQPCLSRFQDGRWSVPDPRVHGNPQLIAATKLPGHTTESLVALGSFIFPETGIEAVIIVWTGTHWEPLGEPTNGLATDYAIMHDRNGNPARLFASGSVGYEGSWYKVAELQDGKWVPLSEQPESSVLTLESFDDGQNEYLYAGTISHSQSMLRWDGEHWSAVDGCPTHEINDGGPNPPLAFVVSLEVDTDSQGQALFVGGRFSVAGNSAARGIARWDGHQWSDMAGGLHNGDAAGTARAISRFDSGEGLRLLVSGGFDRAGSVAASRLACWDGDRWWAVSNETFDGGFHALAVEQGAGGGPDSLFVLGDFKHVGSMLSHRIARWIPSDLAPTIVYEPDDRTRPPGGSTAFDVTIESGAATYQWRHDSSPMIDDDRITGSNTRTLTIMDLQEGDTGEYDVVITNDCGEAITSPATLLVRAQCSGDITGTNTTVDMADFQLVMTWWGPCVNCLADTDGDGVVNMDDLLTVISQWGPCP